MDHETLFTASKWDILKRLERGPASPLELSKDCGTSIANISQQLRLLEMAGLVTSKRVSNRDKGKPRVLYGLAGNLSYLIATSGDFVDKRVVELSEHNKIIMRIWFYPDRALHYTLEKAFWRIEEHLAKVQFLAVDTRSDTHVTLVIKGPAAASLRPFTVTDPTGVTRQVVFSDQVPDRSRLYLLYDPRGNAAENGKPLAKRGTKGESNE